MSIVTHLLLWYRPVRGKANSTSDRAPIELAEKDQVIMELQETIQVHVSVLLCSNIIMHHFSYCK